MKRRTRTAAELTGLADAPKFSATAIGLSQAMQAPLAALATIGNYFHGAANLAVGGAIAGGLAFGGFFGARLAHAIEPATMSRLVAWVLVLVGLLLLGKLSIGLA